MAKPIIIDCDPGVDDAIALLLAFAHPELLTVLGITTVGGNVPLDLVTTNALTICDQAGMHHISVYPGCGRPLVNANLFTAEHVHGISGLGDALLAFPSRQPDLKHGVDFLIDTLHTSSEKVTLVTLGPMTNLAMALVKDPSIKRNIEEVVFMGGAIYEGNVHGGQAEFNIYNDPHAAHVVFSSDLKLTMVGLETTSFAQVTPARAQKLLQMNTPISQFVHSMLGPMHIADIGLGKMGCVLHDVCAIAFLIAPHLFQGRLCPVNVEMASPMTLGRTIVDWHRKTAQPENIYVTHEMKADPFFELLFHALGSYPPMHPEIKLSQHI